MTTDTTPTIEPEAAEQAPAAPGRLDKPLNWLKASKSRMAGAVVGFVAAIGLITTLLLSGGEEVLPAAERLQAALALLDESEAPEAMSTAFRIGDELERENYRPPDFPGAPEYIQGIVEFREAANYEETERSQAYRRAAVSLEKAEHLTVDELHRPEWSHAMGTCRFYLGDIPAAEARLQESAATYPSGRLEAINLLQEIYLNHRTVESLNHAVELNTSLLQQEGLDQEALDGTYLRRAELFLMLDRVPEAEAALAKISEKNSTRKATQVIRAQADIKAHRYAEARERLEPVARDIGLEPLYSRQASYLVGLSYEREEDFDNASVAYGETARLYPRTPEGLAASIRRADLLRLDKRTEEALEHYKDALSQVQPDGFSTRWLTTGEFKQSILTAWKDWVDNREFEPAIKLSQKMTPLFNRAEARQQEASAYEQWALQLDRELSSAGFTVRKARERERRERWRRSGKAHAALADSLVTSSKYSDTLWMSAEHFRNGRDPENELVQLTKFVDTNLQERMALAYVRRGKTLMDLDRLDEAQQHFERVLRQYPADIAAFEARFLIGCCHLERNEPAQAEEAWRAILTSRDLDPSAEEWQSALFALGRLLFQSAVSIDAKSRSDVLGFAKNGPSVEAHARWEESIRRLEEYLSRYPRHADAAEARCLLAKALQHSADLPRFKLQKSAETDNARNELLTVIHDLLRRALVEYSSLQEQLLESDKNDALNELGRSLLRDCYFEKAHTLYALDEFDKAVAAYTSAAVRYSEDPQVLLAYLQLANCYAQMGKRGDALGVAVQALLIHRKLPDQAFQSGTSNISREEWKSWLEWTRQVLQAQPATPTRITSEPKDRS